MKNQYVGIQKVIISHQEENDVVLVECLEEDRLTRVFTNGIRIDRIYASPNEAYEASIHLLGLSGKGVELDIEVACNVMDASDIENTFAKQGVIVNKAILS